MPEKGGIVGMEGLIGMEGVIGYDGLKLGWNGGEKLL
jgi:hypothetical protein